MKYFVSIFVTIWAFSLVVSAEKLKEQGKDIACRSSHLCETPSVKSDLSRSLKNMVKSMESSIPTKLAECLEKLNERVNYLKGLIPQNLRNSLKAATHYCSEFFENVMQHIRKMWSTLLENSPSMRSFVKYFKVSFGKAGNSKCEDCNISKNNLTNDFNRSRRGTKA